MLPRSYVRQGGLRLTCRCLPKAGIKGVSIWVVGQVEGAARETYLKTWACLRRLLALVTSLPRIFRSSPSNSGNLGSWGRGMKVKFNTLNRQDET